jgi:serine/threonine protein kinase
MGEVYRARDPRLDRHVAIKLLPVSLAADPRSRERLRREAMAIAGIDHPYICKIFEIGEHDDALFLVMEFVDGETLHHRLQRGAVALPDALQVAGEMAEALQAAHSRRFLHRDLKPANIMVTEQGHVKVMDFGLAKRVDDPPLPDQATGELEAPQLTALGMIVGTPDYMSPEQVKNVTLDARSDLFSFGVILAIPEAHDAYLKGRYFFNRPSDENLQKAISQFEEAVRLSPEFALAFSGLSDAYLWAGYNEGFLTSTEAKPRARAAAQRAVQLDDDSAEAHTSLAAFELFYGHDLPGCEREFRRALTLNPNYAFAHDQFGMALSFQGRFDEAIAQSRRAIELDPLSPQVLLDAALPFMFQRNSPPAKELARKAADLDPMYFFPVMVDGWIDLEVGKFREAIPALKKARTMESPPFVTAYLAFAYGAAGEREAAMSELTELKKISKDGEMLPFNLALVYLGLGDRARALDNLERALAADSQMVAWLGQDPIFDPLRSEPRFTAILNKMATAR